MAASAIAFSSAGSTFSVCLTQPNTESLADYRALTWIEVGEITSIPAHGKTYNKIEFKGLSVRRIRKLKGSYDQGAMTVAMAFAPGDQGQAALITALDMDESIPCREVLQDGTEIYFKALVMSNPHNIGGVDNITAAEVAFEIDSDETRGYPA